MIIRLSEDESFYIKNGATTTVGSFADWFHCLCSWYCDSGLDSIESPGILTIIDGPEHDELSQVYSHLSSYHVGSHVPTCP